MENKKNSGKPAPAAANYHTLINDMDQGFCIIEVLFDEAEKAMDYRFLETNRVFEKQTGLQNVVGKTIRSLQPAQEQHWFDVYGEVAKTRQRVHFENVAAYLDPSGLAPGVCYDVLAYPFGAVGQNQVAVIFNDITQRRRAEDSLRISEQRLQRVLETDAVGVIFFNYEGTVVQANDVFLHMTGYVQQQIDRRELTWRTMTPPEWVAESVVQMERFQRTGRIGPYEKEYFLADGSRCWMLFAGRDLGDGTIAEYCIDITHHKRTEDALRQSEEKLRQFNLSLENKVAERTRELELSQERLQDTNRQLQDTITRLESFNYIASHDLQEPLRKIETFAALLSEHNLPDETLKRYLAGIQDSSSRMRRLINDLLAYSRLDRSHTFERIDLNQILDHVKTDYEMGIREKNAVIDSDTMPALPVIPFQMYQLFSNLIGNSLKFANDRPEIKITCRTVTEIPFETAATGAANEVYAEIQFSDNGIGFDNQYAERIFQVFQRLHPNTQYPGTGIGLSIVERVVKNHNGFIRATGEKGKGATFTVYLPV
jgi:PAS domain S-box-containing protein